LDLLPPSQQPDGKNLMLSKSHKKNSGWKIRDHNRPPTLIHDRKKKINVGKAKCVREGSHTVRKAITNEA